MLKRPTGLWLRKFPDRRSMAKRRDPRCWKPPVAESHARQTIPWNSPHRLPPRAAGKDKTESCFLFSLSKQFYWNRYNYLKQGLAWKWLGSSDKAAGAPEARNEEAGKTEGPPLPATLPERVYGARGAAAAFPHNGGSQTPRSPRDMSAGSDTPSFLKGLKVRWDVYCTGNIRNLMLSGNWVDLQ